MRALATQSDGFYHPPEYFSSGKYKRKSISKYNNNTTATEVGHNRYLQTGVVRFEIPFNGFCHNCEHYISKGTRYNATKKQMRSYCTNKIYEFRMRCKICTISEFVIRTNPKNRTFDYINGIKRKIEENDDNDIQNAGIIDTEIGNGIITNFKGINNNDHDDKTSNNNTSTVKKAQTEYEHISSLIKINEKTAADDATSNSNLRDKFRKERNIRKRTIQHTTELGLGDSGIVLQDVTRKDCFKAKRIFQNKELLVLKDDSKIRRMEKKKLKSIRSSSIFDTKKRQRRHGHGKKTQVVVQSNIKRSCAAINKPMKKKRLVKLEKGIKTTLNKMNDKKSISDEDEDNNTNKLNSLSLVAMYNSSDSD